jgi:hypothetical protein
MPVRSDRERYDSVAPYVQTFAHLRSRRTRRWRRIPRLEFRLPRLGARIPRLGLICTVVLAVAISSWRGPAKHAPVARIAAPQSNADTRQIAAVAPPEPTALPAGAPFVSEIEHPTPEAPTAEPEPQTADVQGPEPQAPTIAPSANVASPAPAPRDRTAQPRSRIGFNVYAIRRLLDRYAVDAEPDEPAGARELDVHAHLLSIREDGDRTVVRFTRRHRYRDALGRLVMRETPPMQTTVVKTAEGVRFETPPI